MSITLYWERKKTRPVSTRTCATPGEAEMKIYKRFLQALLSSAPRGFATRSRVLSRVASLAIHEDRKTYKLSN